MTSIRYKDEVFNAFTRFLEQEWARKEGLGDSSNDFCGERLRQVSSLVEFLSKNSTETLHALQVLAHD